MEALDRGGALLFQPEGVDFYTAVSLDGYAVNRPRVLDGRLPQGVDEMALSQQAADVLHKAVGDALELRGRGPRQAERFLIEGDTSAFHEPPDGPRVVLRVVGLVDAAGDIGRVDLSGAYGW
ncbi:MAG: hypothetical protein LC808_04200 [Actinobacteria bacterium]|nr:hypothetical protein [Actinomycetota bacterium]